MTRWRDTGWLGRNLGGQGPASWRDGFHPPPDTEQGRGCGGTGGHDTLPDLTQEGFGWLGVGYLETVYFPGSFSKQAQLYQDVSENPIPFLENQAPGFLCKGGPA